MQHLLAANYQNMTVAPTALPVALQPGVNWNQTSPYANIYSPQAAILPGAASYAQYSAGLLGATPQMAGYHEAPQFAQAGPVGGPMVTYYTPGANGELLTGTSVYQQAPFGAGQYTRGAWDMIMPRQPMLPPVAAVGQPAFVQDQLVQQQHAAANAPQMRWG
jgi:hypothetical protein